MHALHHGFITFARASLDAAAAAAAAAVDDDDDDDDVLEPRASGLLDSMTQFPNK
jgi:hypothetical protein